MTARLEHVLVPAGKGADGYDRDMPAVVTVPAKNVRIPPAARAALARHEPVIVLSRGRPAFVIVSPDDYAARGRAPGDPVVRTLQAAVEILRSAPNPDPGFGDDLEAIRAAVDAMPASTGQGPRERYGFPDGPSGMPYSVPTAGRALPGTRRPVRAHELIDPQA